jgi:hypothetical protein
MCHQRGRGANSDLPIKMTLNYMTVVREPNGATKSVLRVHSESARCSVASCRRVFTGADNHGMLKRGTPRVSEKQIDYRCVATGMWF